LDRRKDDDGAGRSAASRQAHAHAAPKAVVPMHRDVVSGSGGGSNKSPEYNPAYNPAWGGRRSVQQEIRDELDELLGNNRV